MYVIHGVSQPVYVITGIDDKDTIESLDEK